MCSDLLSFYEAHDESFLSRIATEDETWIYHFQPQTKIYPMEWYHSTSFPKKKFKATHLAGKFMATISRDAGEGDVGIQYDT